MPLLCEMGFGLMHLDPGWETVFGSNVWNDSVMGEPESFVAEANKHWPEGGLLDCGAYQRPRGARG